MSVSNSAIVNRLTRSGFFRDYARAFAVALDVPLTLVARPEGETGPLPLAAPSSAIATVPVCLGERPIGDLCVRFRPTIARAAGGARVSSRQRAMLALLQVFAAHLALIGNRLVLQDNAPESPVVTRVRQYVAQQMAEDIKLADAARVAHMSPCYFCKVFRRATGLSFTEYLARLRVECASARLLDPHRRVSEIAFEVGFQSLSHFNRAFRRVTGCCPTEYRGSCPPTTPSSVALRHRDRGSVASRPPPVSRLRARMAAAGA